MTIKEARQKIKRNKFINDMNWRERARENSILERYITIKERGLK